MFTKDGRNLEFVVNGCSRFAVLQFEKVAQGFSPELDSSAGVLACAADF
jgi:hypothetical protein